MTDKITDGVGKKIVEALKQQSDIEIENVVNNSESIDSAFENVSDYKEDLNINYENEIPKDNITKPGVMTFAQTTSQSEDYDDFDVPNNIAVLKQLINQLPAGVSKQTGAQIIKQTMEALGISMKSVLQEAQQVQENLNQSSRECQASIVEHKKQIGILERQSQKYQRQYASLNDVISLFVQTNI